MAWLSPWGVISCFLSLCLSLSLQEVACPVGKESQKRIAVLGPLSCLARAENRPRKRQEHVLLVFFPQCSCGHHIPAKLAFPLEAECSFFFFWRVFCCRTRVLARETESEKSLPGGIATPQSLLLHSPLGTLGTHAHTPGVSLSHQVWDANRCLLHGSPAT